MYDYLPKRYREYLEWRERNEGNQTAPPHRKLPKKRSKSGKVQSFSGNSQSSPHQEKNVAKNTVASLQGKTHSGKVEHRLCQRSFISGRYLYPLLADMGRNVREAFKRDIIE